MSEQQSQKTGVRSDAQKNERARDGYDPIAPANPVAGAFGDRERDTPATPRRITNERTTHCVRKDVP